MADNQRPVFCLMGPTAAGKTQLAVHLVLRFPCEIISVDSAMVYRGMDIGTAKPSAAVLAVAPHRLINICDPSDAYSAAQFKTDALREIADVQSKGKIPLLVGGSMLYFRVLQQGMALMPSANAAIRVEITREAEKLGWPLLHARLARVDKESAARINPNDSQRIQRALEVYRLSGKSLTHWISSEVKSESNCQFHSLIISPNDRAVLHARIKLRFMQMLDDGFVEEVKCLYSRGDIDESMPAMRSAGYRQVWQYLQGRLTYEAMCEHGIIATRQLAKRQLTWLRRWPSAVWFNSEENDFTSQVEKYFLRFI